MASKEEMAELTEVVRKQCELLKLMQSQLQMQQGTQQSRIHIPWPAPLDVDSGDPGEALDFFKTTWLNYATATGLKEEQRPTLLINAIGHAAMKKYMHFGLDDKDMKSEAKIFEKLEEKLRKKHNVIYSRYMFNQRSQAEGEDIDTYILELRKLMKTCEYSNIIIDEVLRDRIVVGIRNPEIKKELLRIDQLDLTQTIKICKSAEATTAQLQNLCSEQVFAKIHKLDKKQTKVDSKPLLCKFCGEKHIFKKKICPAWGKKCENCQGRNHSKNVCKKTKMVKELHTEDSEEEVSDNSTYISKIRTNRHSGHKEVELYLKFSNTWLNVYCTLDTGAHVCVIGAEQYKNLCKKDNLKHLCPTDLKLKCFNETDIETLGVTDVECIHKNKKYVINFHVVNVSHQPLLSESACVALGLIKYCNAVSVGNARAMEAQNIISKYSDVFEGYGELPGIVDLEIDENVPPRIQPARRVPMALRAPLKDELDRLVKDNIIVKEESHTDWVNNILIVRKGKKFRICLDPIPLNKALKRPHFQFTTLEEVLPELGKAKVFSTVDALKGFWHVRLNERSSKLTTFWTPFGRYRWLRLPFGISSAPEIFQQKLLSTLHGLKGIEVMADDILIYGVGDTTEDAVKNHNINLENLLIRLRENNCKLNKDKLNLLQKSVKFYGHMLTDTGLKVDEEKITAIKNIAIPTNSKDVLRLLGMVTYLSKFIKNLSLKVTSLRELTKKNAIWQWTEKEQLEFDEIISSLSSLPTLKYYDMNKPLIVECDASSMGLGAALYQNNEVVAFASRTLTSTEKRYAQIEKEMLAVVFACSRFSQYITANTNTIIKTDHKPLINIFKKPLVEAPKRLQLMLMILQRYDLKIEYISGKNNFVADALSRAPTPIQDDSHSFNNAKQIFEIISKHSSAKYLKVSNKIIESIKKEVENDPECRELKKYIVNGFPDYISDMPENLRWFYKFASDLSIQEDIIFKNDQILIPRCMRNYMLPKIHKSHSGVASSIKLAKQNIFWPGMSEDIKNFVEKCKICIKYSPSLTRFPMLSHDIPMYPFQYISMDVFNVKLNSQSLNFLITADHYSNFYEIDKLKNLSSSEVVNICKKNFARYGIPQKICTDGATNFVNREFSMFAEEWDFIHVTSSPHYPQSNGIAEATVKSAKKLILKSYEAGEDFWISLLHQRNVPSAGDDCSPAQKFLSRKTRTLMPYVTEQLIPVLMTDIPKRIKAKRDKSKCYYDKKCKQPFSLYIGQNVAVQLSPEHTNTWKLGFVVEKVNERSYKVNVDGVIYRRDLTHIKPFKGVLKENEEITNKNKEKKKTGIIDNFENNDANKNKSVMYDNTDYGCELILDNNVIPNTDTSLDTAEPISSQSHSTRPVRSRCLPVRFNDYTLD